MKERASLSRPAKISQEASKFLIVMEKSATLDSS